MIKISKKLKKYWATVLIMQKNQNHAKNLGSVTFIP